MNWPNLLVWCLVDCFKTIQKFREKTFLGLHLACMLNKAIHDLWTPKPTTELVGMSLMSSSSSTYGWVRGLRRRVFFFSAAATTGVFVCLLEEDSRQNSCSSSSGFAQLRRSIQELVPSSSSSPRVIARYEGRVWAIREAGRRRPKKDAHLMLAAVDTIAKGMQKKQSNANQIRTQNRNSDTQLLQTNNSCPFSGSDPLFVCCCCGSLLQKFSDNLQLRIMKRKGEVPHCVVSCTKLLEREREREREEWAAPIVSDNSASFS